MGRKAFHTRWVVSKIAFASGWYNRFLLKAIIVLLMVLLNPTLALYASYTTTERIQGGFTLCEDGHVPPIYASSGDHAGVLRVLQHIQTDFEKVTSVKPLLWIDRSPSESEVILVGTIGKHALIEKLVNDRKLRIDDLIGRWEVFVIQVIEKPFPGVDRALVIVGSDKRGTIYGLFDLAKNMGVSPWYWWADVPVQPQSRLYVRPGRFTEGEPAVKYRGIFINDEAPALSGWAFEKFGGFNHKFYDKVFELILRLKGNFLWPAMWGRAFYTDDPINPQLADEYGVVIGTSHHEPMMRAHAEWAAYGTGPWNYEKNRDVLRAFWRRGIERMGQYESIVTIGMRGDGDEPMTEEANIALLQRIVQDQRQIITEVTGKDASEIPQVWALYKEVQEYYDKGMRVPDDVTLLLCDDNWGNIRKLPRPDQPPHRGGYGIYYHYDYVGGPRNYKWLNTNQISRVWEQMHLAYEMGAKKIWIVNVGDIKPMEFPIEFFLDYAWAPDRWPAERIPEYTYLWAKNQYGSQYAQEIATLLREYTRFNSRRKPELLSPDTYSLFHFREAERIVEEYNQLADLAQRINQSLPANYRDAFYQLVLYPVLACANLNDLYVRVGKNRLYAQQGRAATNRLAQRARELFARDEELSRYYHQEISGGKWNHMMSQTHIGYTTWQQPEIQIMPEVRSISLPLAGQMGVAVEGSTAWWPEEKSPAYLPVFDVFNQQAYYIEIFNRGQKSFHFSIHTPNTWIKVEPAAGEITDEKRVWVSINWGQVPSGKHEVPLTINGPGKTRVLVKVTIHKPPSPLPEEVHYFVEANGYVSIEAEHVSRVINKDPVYWQCIPELGRTLSAMTLFPATSPPQSPQENGPRLEYDLYLFSQGEVTVKAYLSPTLNFHDHQGLRYAISFDDQPPQIVNMHEGRTFQDWEESVRNNITVTLSRHRIDKPGLHVLKFWGVDTGVVLQKIVVETAAVPYSYLGPPESFRGIRK